jgi:hypothetical protein
MAENRAEICSTDRKKIWQFELRRTNQLLLPIFEMHILNKALLSVNLLQGFPSRSPNLPSYCLGFCLYLHVSCITFAILHFRAQLNYLKLITYIYYKYFQKFIAVFVNIPLETTFYALRLRIFKVYCHYRFHRPRAGSSVTNVRT